jgi:hypothetical protein
MRGQSPKTITFDYGDGECTLTLSAWSKVTGIPRTTLAARYDAGYAPAQILGVEPIPKARVYQTTDKRSGTLAQWIDWTGAAKETLRKRIARGWTIDEAITGTRASPPPVMAMPAVRINMSVLIDRDF